MHPYQGTPLSNKEEPTTDTGNNLTEPQGNCADGKEANGRGYKLHDPIDVTSVKYHNRNGGHVRGCQMLGMGVCSYEGSSREPCDRPVKDPDCGGGYTKLHAR